MRGQKPARKGELIADKGIEAFVENFGKLCEHIEAGFGYGVLPGAHRALIYAEHSRKLRLREVLRLAQALQIFRKPNFFHKSNITKYYGKILDIPIILVYRVIYTGVC